MVMLRSRSGIEYACLVASVIPLRNLVKPKRTEWVKLPVLKSTPAACTGVLLTLVKG